MASRKQRTPTESTPPSDQEAMQSLADAGTATAEARQPGEEPAEPQQSFAAREEKRERKPYPNPLPHIIDNAAGVTYQTAVRERNGKKEYTAEIVFADGGPPKHVKDHMKAKELAWKGDVKAWSHPRGYKTQGADQWHGNVVAREVIDLMRAHKGHEPAGRFADAEDQRREAGQEPGGPGF